MSATLDILSPADQEGTEATVLRWLKQPGEEVAENEPLLELETDKVTVEVPSPASGRLLEILAQEKAEVAPGAVLGRLSTAAAIDAASEPTSSPQHVLPPSARLRGDDAVGRAAHGAVAEGLGVHTRQGEVGLSNAVGVSAPFSPAVKRLLAEHGLSPAKIPATGKGGRLTAQDITRYIEGLNTYAPATPLSERHQQTPPNASGATATTAAPGGSRRIPHSPIRRRIAAHMLSSVQTAPHVTTVFEADLTRVVAHRARHAKDFEARGVKLTYTSYFVAAATQALMSVPEVNSRFHDDTLEIFSDCNIGVGTALGNDGLIVPVLHRTQTMDLFGIARKLGDLVAAARAGRLASDAVRGGTFTISNHGVSGSLLAAPIVINQPQSAILGIGKLEKRVVVEEIEGADAIRIKPMCYVTLTIDHRALDAFQANAFLTKLVAALQDWPLSH